MIDPTFKEETLANIERFYNEATDPDFDVPPALIMSQDDVVHIYPLFDGFTRAPELATEVLAAHTAQHGTPDGLAFVSAMWRRDSARPNEIVGEGVTVVFETETSQEFVIYDVARAPLKLTKGDAVTSGMSAHPLLYQPEAIN